MNKKPLIILFGFLIVVLLVTGYTMGLFSNKQKEESGKWKTCEVIRRDIGSSVLATGIIKTSVGAEVKVGSRVSGVVKHLYVKIGDPVKKGQMLGELDPTEYQARFQQALAKLENAKARLQYAELDIKRQRGLKKKNFTPQNKVDEAETAYEVALSEVKQAKANLNYAKIQLDYTRIHAPISGVVASVSTQKGETVAASFTAPTFVVIIDLNRLEVWAYVDETDIGRIKEGQSASFTVDTYRDVEFNGKVTAIYPKAEMKDNVVNYIAVINITEGAAPPIQEELRKQKVKAKSKQSQNKSKNLERSNTDSPVLILRPEMTTTVRIFQERKTNVLTIPKHILLREAGKKFVYVLKGKKMEKHWIKTGWTDGKYIEVIQGLKQGEKIIIKKKEDI